MRIVIVGNGPAAVAAAETIRDLDGGCGIVMVSQESVPFYSPCPLAEYVEASVPRAHLFLRPESFYRDLGIETRFGLAATAVDSAARKLTLGSGAAATQLEYDRLLIAAGARAVMPPLPGLADTPGVFALKTLADAEGILARLAQVRRAVVIGSGFIGLEAAQALVRKGVAVTVIEAMGQVLPQMLDAELAALVESRLREHGVDVRTNSAAQAVLGGAAGVAAVKAGGVDIPCELVVCAAGVRPDVAWLAGSGIATAAGVLVDDRMATNLPGIYAAGDIVETNDSLGQRRVIGNWPNAVNGGRIAGLNMMGVERRYRGLDGINVVRIFDLPVSSFGGRDGERSLCRKEGGHMRKLALRNGRIVGGQFYGDVNGTGLYHELMNKGVDVGSFEDELLAPGFGIGRLMPQPPLPLRRAA
ncbi:MAG: NAD(P)/FAD-dependent oxidoreductase [Rhodocyclales bacterium]|nr:NAD(P)/FAD-dependent oxidoreductase [Rhodocyclales bacterium]